MYLLIYLFKKAALPHLDLVLLVKWNFVGQGKRQLTLDIGDTVHIEEFCDGKIQPHWTFFFSFLISSINVVF